MLAPSLAPLVALAALAASPSQAPEPDPREGGSWPTFRADRARSGRVEAALVPERLERVWTHRSPQAPRPAWPGPARWDAYAALPGLSAMREYDPVHHVSAVGGRVWYGSSADDAVRCLDATTGDVLWSFVTEGPVRIAPTYDDGRLYFGSDDGAAYCVDAATGEPIWRHHPTDGRRKFVNDGRVVSQWPVRSGVAVADGVAYFTASMFPWQPSYVCAVDARTGTLEQVEGEAPRYVRDLGPGWTMEGALVVGSRDLILPQGRVAPLVFDRATGESRGQLSGGGGSFCLLVDDRVLHGPGNKQGWITDSDASSRERVATYERGHAVVVDEAAAYVLSERSLAALDRETRGVLWTRASETPFALIQVGRALLAGGDGVVEARACEDGTLLWRAPVEGRAHGLAFADGRLLVSTDTGALAAFAMGDVALPRPTDAGGELVDLEPAPAVDDADDPALVDRWVFRWDADVERGGVIPNEARALDIELPSSPPIKAVGGLHAWFLDGRSTDAELAPSLAAADLPTEALTATAWVRLDRAREWGGWIGAAQDNGAYERGWLLGYRQRQLGFCVNGAGGAEGLTWLRDPAATELGSWHHVAGTYDGEWARLYVDGELVAESGDQVGPIDYPDEAVYHFGAYRDDDEYFRAEGAVHELRVYARALEPDELRGQFEAKRHLFPAPVVVADAPEPARLAVGPELRFVAPGTARVRFETAERVAPTLELHAPDGSLARALEGRAARQHEFVLDGLASRALYTYRIDAGAGWTASFECDTHFDFAMPELTVPAADPSVSALVDEALARVPERGIAVLLGVGDGAVALELARRSELTVLALTESEEEAAAARARLLELGAHGRRVSVQVVEPDAPLDLPRAFANVLARGDAGLDVEPWLDRGVLGVVRPDGGRVALGDAGRERLAGDRRFRSELVDGRREFLRAPLPGAGAWTHMYGRPDNSAYGGESLGGADSIDDLELQWAGRPGPRYQSDRGNRKPSPLAAGGRLYAQGLRRVLALDSYNGAVLWSLELPELARFNVPRSASNWCADEESVFLAMGRRVVRLDGQTGEETGRYDLPDRLDREFAQEWGYVARQGELLLGTSVMAGSQFTDFWGPTRWYDAKSGADAAKVVSDRVFGLHEPTGVLVWRHDGLVLDSTITVADGRIWFVECRNPEVAALEHRRVHGDALWQDLVMVCLDADTGQSVWEREALPMPGTAAFAMAHGDGRLTLLSSHDGSFGLYVFDAASGDSLWRRKFGWEADHHGKHLARPAIVGGKVFVRPLAFDLASGEPLDLAFPGGHQCGTYTCADNAIFLRAGELAMWDIEGGGASRWRRVRPDCWISSIPANGMLLSPEGGGGCSCGSWLETSMGFLPRSVR